MISADLTSEKILILLYYGIKTSISALISNQYMWPWFPHSSFKRGRYFQRVEYKQWSKIYMLFSPIKWIMLLFESLSAKFLFRQSLNFVYLMILKTLIVNVEFRSWHSDLLCFLQIISKVDHLYNLIFKKDFWIQGSWTNYLVAFFVRWRILQNLVLIY